MGQLPSDCERTHGYVSASVDGELSEVEGMLLEGHLAACESCRGYAASVAQTARLLRRDPLEELDFAIVLPSRRLAVARKLQVGAVAAALALTFGLSAVIGTIGSRQTSSRSGSKVAAGARDSALLRSPEAELKMLHDASVARSRLVIHSRTAV
jgi:predicted anti-sigma-YlaC factor YlaD